MAKSLTATLDDVAQRLSEIQGEIQAAARRLQGRPDLEGAARFLEVELEKLLLVTGELAGTAKARSLLGAGTYCRACGTVFPARLVGDCPNCDTMGRLLPLHDEAEVVSLERWRPRFKLPDPQQVRLRRAPAPAAETVGPAVPSPR
jgi:hypothetical protein